MKRNAPERIVLTIKITAKGMRDRDVKEAAIALIRALAHAKPKKIPIAAI